MATTFTGLEDWRIYLYMYMFGIFILKKKQHWREFILDFLFKRKQTLQCQEFFCLENFSIYTGSGTISRRTFSRRSCHEWNLFCQKSNKQTIFLCHKWNENFHEWKKFCHIWNKSFHKRKIFCQEWILFVNFEIKNVVKNEIIIFRS